VRSSAFWVAVTAALAALSYLVARYVALGPVPGPWAYWPSTGILLGILFRRPRKEWVYLALSAVVAQALAIRVVGGDTASGAMQVAAVASAVQAFAAAWVLRTYGSAESPLGGARDLMLFAGVAVSLIPLVVSPLPALAFSRDLGVPFEVVWPPLFVGNSLSILLFAAVLLQRWPLGRTREPPHHVAETALCQACIVGVALVTFLREGGWLQYVVLPYALFPLLAWSAVRCGPRWTSIAVVVVNTIAAWCTTRGLGPFAQLGAPLEERVLGLQVYLAFAGFTALLLCAVTAQRRAAFVELSLQNAVLNAFFDSSTTMVAMKDVSGTYLRVNGAFAKAFGAGIGDVTGHTAREVLDERDAAIVEANDRQVLERGVPLTFDESIIVHGSRRSLVTTRFPVRSASGEIRYLGLVAHDETVERDLAERLRRAQKVEMIGQLAAGLAHDLNNVLSVMLGSTDLLRMTAGASAEDRELLHDMHVAGGRATKLTGRLLALARGAPAARAPVAFDSLLGEFAPMLNAMARGNVEVHTDFAASGARVLADPVEVEQIVLNLVSNARDAIEPPGRIDVSTRVRAVDEGRRLVTLRVSDTGRGMDDATLERIFEPLFTTKEGRGTGIGLYTTALLVRQMGGTIDVVSRVGEGSTFVVELPALAS
jgi:PAS domain S-box-containing protein